MYDHSKELQMKIICLSAWKGSGKDTCADRLVEYGAVRVALADPLKDSVAKEYQIDRKSLDDPKTKESPLLNLPVEAKDGFSEMIANYMVREFRTWDGFPADVAHVRVNNGNFQTFINGWENVYWTPRALAILKGSTNRSVKSNFWVEKAFDKIDDLSGALAVVVTDLRYKSELNQFREQWGKDVVFVRINRFDSSPSTDPSERDLDDVVFDYEINNKGTLKELYDSLAVLIFKVCYSPSAD
jgi:hypothetical protein